MNRLKSKLFKTFALLSSMTIGSAVAQTTSVPTVVVLPSPYGKFSGAGFRTNSQGAETPVSDPIQVWVSYTGPEDGTLAIIYSPNRAGAALYTVEEVVADGIGGGVLKQYLWKQIFVNSDGVPTTVGTQSACPVSDAGQGNANQQNTESTSASAVPSSSHQNSYLAAFDPTQRQWTLTPQNTLICADSIRVRADNSLPNWQISVPRTVNRWSSPSNSATSFTTDFLAQNPAGQGTLYWNPNRDFSASIRTVLPMTLSPLKTGIFGLWGLQTSLTDNVATSRVLSRPEIWMAFFETTSNRSSTRTALAVAQRPTRRPCSCFYSASPLTAQN